MIIPFFITHAGCKHQCVFCNQVNITGQKGPTDAAAVPGTIERYLGSRGTREPVSVAFYGGSFTALPRTVQESYLEAVRPYIETGRIMDIRLSTRPDCIDRGVLDLLIRYHVGTIELGVQSMDDRVLALAGRGHAAADTVRALALLRQYQFRIGLQLMPGLPGDSRDGFRKTVDAVISLNPDFVRLYPALVIKDTPLERLYCTDEYEPLSLDAAVSLCQEAAVKFRKAGMTVARMGLQPTAELDRPGTIVAGPYHPAFGQLVESAILLDSMREALRQSGEKKKIAVFGVDARDLSTAVGQRRENIAKLKKEFELTEVRIVGEAGGRRGKVALSA